MIQACKDLIDLFIGTVLYVITLFATEPILFTILVFSVFNAVIGFVFGIFGIGDKDNYVNS